MAHRLAKKLATSGVPPIPSETSLATLSPREMEVLSFAAAGYLDKQIGVALGLSLNTLRTYWSRIRAKLGPVPRAALVASFTEMSIKTQEDLQIPDWDWEMNLRTGLYRSLSARSMVGMNSEMPIEDVLSMIHPEDLPGVRWLIASAQAGQFRAFHYSARFLTKEGPRTGSAFVKVSGDEDGPYLLHGQRVPLMDMRANSKTAIGYWGYDFTTSKFWIDEACASLLEIDANGADPLAAFLNRFERPSRERIHKLIESRSALDPAIGRRFSVLRPDGSKMDLNFDIYEERGAEGVERIVCGVSIDP